MTDYRKYYNIFKCLPNILLWVNITMGLLIGLLLVATFEILGLFVCIVGGIISGFISYLMTAIMISPIVIITDSKLENKQV